MSKDWLTIYTGEHLLTPELSQAVGRVIMHWAIFESSFDNFLTETYLATGTKTAPQQFSQKVLGILEHLQPRLSDIDFSGLSNFLLSAIELHSQRHDLAHGTPGKITCDGETFFGVVRQKKPLTDKWVEEFSIERIHALDESIKKLSSKWHSTWIEIIGHSISNIDAIKNIPTPR